MPYIKYGAQHVMKLMTIPEMRAIFITSTNPFLKYHTTYSSSGSVCKMVCESLGVMRVALVSAATYGLVLTSAEEFWNVAANAAIPTGMKAMAMVWLKVNNKEIDWWYQGEGQYRKMQKSKMFRMEKPERQILEGCTKQLVYRATGQTVYAAGRNTWPKRENVNIN